MRIDAWCNLINKEPHLCDVSLRIIFRRFAEIGWNPIVLLRRLRVDVAPNHCGDDLIISTDSVWKIHGKDQAFHCRRSVSNQILVVHKNSLADIVLREAEGNALDVVDTILKEIGTSYDAEIKKRHENLINMAVTHPYQGSFLPANDVDQLVKDWISLFKSDPKSKWPNIPIVSDPNIPKNQMAFVVDGEVVAVAKNIGVMDQPTSHMKVLQESVRLRHKQAK